MGTLPEVVGCTGEPAPLEDSGNVPAFPSPSEATCYEFETCSKIAATQINRMCEVSNMGHEASGLVVLLAQAFQELVVIDVCCVLI